MLLESFPILAFSVSATTRKPRKGEIHGKDYYFVSKEIFLEWLKKGLFLETEEVYPGIFYGTLYSEIERIRNMGKVPLFDVDINGAIKIKTIFKENFYTIFLEPPSIDDLKKRLSKRGTEEPQSIQNRINKAQAELALKDKCDYCLINDNLSQTFEKVSEIVRKVLKI